MKDVDDDIRFLGKMGKIVFWVSLSFVVFWLLLLILVLVKLV